MQRAPRPTRRAAVTVAGALIAGLTLTGCGIHLEENAPHVPLLPTRDPIAGESGLLTLLRNSRALAAALPSGGKTAAGLAAAHRTQASVLDSALRREGVPASVLDPVAPPPTNLATRTGLATAEARSVTVLDKLIEQVDPTLLPMIASLRVARVVAAHALNPRYAAPAAPAAAVPKEPALAVLAATREAVYGVEVAAARSGGAPRERAIALLAELRTLVLEQEDAAGDAAPPTPLSYSLPFPVTDNASGTRLISTLLARLVSGYAATLASLGSDRPAAGVITRWLTEVSLLSSSAGNKTAPFPGLT